MRNSYMNLIILAICFACSSKDLPKENQIDRVDNRGEKYLSKDSVINNRLLELSKHFQERSLPFEVCHNCSSTFDEFGEIPSDVIKEFFPYETEILKHQFYYQFRLKLGKYLTGLIYYKTYDDHFDYILTVFDENGKFLNHFVVASVIGEFDTTAEKKCTFNSDNTFLLKELSLVEVNNNGDKGKANKTESFYQIDESGDIKLVKKGAMTITNVYLDDTGSIKEIR